jgi:hypothetical protein
MNSFEWLELDNLLQDIAGLEHRLRGVKILGNRSLLKLLEHRLHDANKRRTLLLKLIAKHMAAPSIAHAQYIRSAYQIG